MLDRRELDRSPAGGDPSARNLLVTPGRARAPDRREPDILPAGGDPPDRGFGRYQAGTGCPNAGTRRVAGPGAVSRPALAGHYQAGTGRLFAGRAPVHRAGEDPGRISPGTARRALSVRSLEERRRGGRSEPDRHVVVSGPSQLPGPGGPAGPAHGRPACQSAGRVHGLGHRATSPLRQARGTDL